MYQEYFQACFRKPYSMIERAHKLTFLPALLFGVLAGLAFEPAAAGASVHHPLTDAARDTGIAERPAPLWTSEPRFEALLQALHGLQAHGLNPDHYGYRSLQGLRNRPAERERPATAAWFKAARDLVHGRVPDGEAEPELREGRRAIDLDRHLHSAAATGRIAESLDDLAPRHAEYRALMAELARLQTEPNDGLIPIPEGPLLERGDAGLRVQMLRARLTQLGYLPNGGASDVFDDQVGQAVEMLQWDSGLEPDGIVGPATRSVLNMSRARKIERLRINLERWRRLPDNLGRRHVRVNIAGFEVTAYADGMRVQTHRAIVGRLERQTPVFSDAIEYIVLNPWWETPDKLARRDELPLFRRDPEAVQRLGFQVIDRATGQPVAPDTIDWNQVPASPFPYRLRQAPGPMNALGQVKILFPNRHSVYLHDTPKRQLFDRSKRTFSSGCIRVQDVMQLVAWLLQDAETWDLARLRSAVDTGAEQWITLPTPVPVHILYLTAVVGLDGSIQYLPDVYDRDEAVLQALDPPVPVAQTDY